MTEPSSGFALSSHTASSHADVQEWERRFSCASSHTYPSLKVWFTAAWDVDKNQELNRNSFFQERVCWSIPYGLSQDMNYITIRAQHSWFLSLPIPHRLLLSVRLKEGKRSCWGQSHSLCLFHAGLAVELILVCSFSAMLLCWEVLRFTLFLLVTLCLRIRNPGLTNPLWSHIKTIFSNLVLSDISLVFLFL